MTPEEMERMLQKHDEALERIERNIELVTNQQARFYSDLQGLTARLNGFEKAAEEARARQDARIANLTDLVGRMASAQIQLIGVVDRLSDRVDALAARIAGLAARIDQLAVVTQERLNALAEAQKTSEERLNSFIALVVRYISGRNGGDVPR